MTVERRTDLDHASPHHQARNLDAQHQRLIQQYGTWEDYWRAACAPHTAPLRYESLLRRQDHGDGD